MSKRTTYLIAISGYLMAHTAAFSSSSEKQDKESKVFTEQNFRDRMYINDSAGSGLAIISTALGPHAKLKSNGGDSVASISAAVAQPQGIITYYLDLRINYFSSRWAFVDAVTHDGSGHLQTVKASRSKRQVVACFSTCKYEESLSFPLSAADVELAAARETGMIVSLSGGGLTWQMTVPANEFRALKETAQRYQMKLPGGSSLIPSTAPQTLIIADPIGTVAFWRNAQNLSFQQTLQTFPQHRIVTHQHVTSVLTEVVDEQFGVPLDLTLVFKEKKLASMLRGIPEKALVQTNQVEEAYVKAAAKLSTFYAKIGPEVTNSIESMRHRTTKFRGEREMVEVTYLELPRQKASLLIRAEMTE